MKKSIYDFNSYKDFVNHFILHLPKKGYGQFRKMALFLQVNPVIITQIFKGDRQLTLEQGHDLVTYFGLPSHEADYFLLLIQWEKAGNPRLKDYFKKRIHEQKEKSKDLKERIPHEKILTEESKALFYSNWHYSGIRMACSLQQVKTLENVVECLNLPRATVSRALEFLLAHGLIIEKGGKLELGPRLTHLESTSPLITRHHSNWRLKALQNMETIRNEELFYSAPMSLSLDDAQWVRSQLVQLIESVVQRVKISPAERLACLNIDWFDFSKK